MNRREKDNLFQFITEVSFALDDVVLYLDTHPCDTEALCYYEEYKKARKKAIDDYTKLYGPIEKYNVDSCKCWAWTEEPWPWEIEGGC